MSPVRTTIATFAALASLMLAPAAHASAFMLTFEGLADLEPVGGYYDGGFGDQGSGPGPALGLVADSNLWAIKPVSAGGSGNFTNPPAPGNTVAVLANGTRAVISAGHGVVGTFGFAYTASAAFTVSIFDGLNGAGNDLVDFNLPVTGFDTFGIVSADFAGYGKSIVISGEAGTFGIDTVTGVVSEPAAFALLGAGMAALAIARRPSR